MYVWISDKRLLVFDVLVYRILMSETLLFVFVVLLHMWISLRYNHFFSYLIYYLSIVGYPPPVISRCLDIRWNTSSRVWPITSRCLDIRWNTPSRVDILLIGVLISNETLPLVFDILLLSVWISDETLLLVLIYYLLVFWYRMKHSFSCLICYSS